MGGGGATAGDTGAGGIEAAAIELTATDGAAGEDADDVATLPMDDIWWWCMYWCGTGTSGLVPGTYTGGPGCRKAADAALEPSWYEGRCMARFWNMAAAPMPSTYNAFAVGRCSAPRSAPALTASTRVSLLPDAVQSAAWTWELGNLRIMGRHCRNAVDGC